MKQHSLLIVLTLLGLLLIATSVRGAFIIDEINYMVTAVALSEGRLTLANTENLPPSKELLFFDPESYNREVRATPVASIAPPLYAPFALPFLFLGWRGLVLLNTLSFLLAAYLVFYAVKRSSSAPFAPWLALSLFVLGGFGLEYAQGVWPHMLTVALCTGAVCFVTAAHENEEFALPLVGGLLIGLACGIREQNIFFAGCLGLTLLIWGKRRLRSAGAYAMGIAVPLIVSATLNYYRIGVWHPSPKANAYAQLVSGQANAASWIDPLKVFWVRIIDFSAFTSFRDPGQFFDYSLEPSTGALLVGGIVKKALLQSSPWIGLALVLMVLVWTRFGTISEIAKGRIRPLSIIVLPTIGAFALAGFRTDGLSFNQRYLHEIIPLTAITLALAIDTMVPSIKNAAIGFLIGALAFAVTLMIPSQVINHIATLRIPLVLAMLLVIAWFLHSHAFFRKSFPVLLGACIGWSLGVQTIDIARSREIRLINGRDLAALSAAIPDHSALFAYWGRQKAAAGPLLLNKDIVILDASADGGKDAPALAAELLRKDRQVYVLATGMPPEIMGHIEKFDSLTTVLSKPFLLYRISDRKNSQEDQPSLIGSTSLRELSLSHSF